MLDLVFIALQLVWLAFGATCLVIFVVLLREGWALRKAQEHGERHGSPAHNRAPLRAESHRAGRDSPLAA